MRYLMLVLLIGCSNAAGPRPNVSVTVTSGVSTNGCLMKWTARADNHTSVPYYVLTNDATGAVAMTYSGSFVDSISRGYDGSFLPWRMIWNFFDRNDSLDHASIHTDCTAHLCGKVQSTC